MSWENPENSETSPGAPAEHVKKSMPSLHPEQNQVPLSRHSEGRPLNAAEVKSVRSLERNLVEHEKKLADYKRDPYAYDNKGLLKAAPSDEVRQQIIQGRIRHLETEINAFQENIRKIIGG